MYGYLSDLCTVYIAQPKALPDLIWIERCKVFSQRRLPKRQLPIRLGLLKGEGAERLDQDRLGKFPLGKIPDWEVAAWEKAFGKVTNIISINPLFIDWHSKFTMVYLKALTDQERITFSGFQNWLFSILVSLTKVTNEFLVLLLKQKDKFYFLSCY